MTEGEWNQRILNVHREEDPRTTVIERTSSTKRTGFRVKVDLKNADETRALIDDAVRYSRYADQEYDKEATNGKASTVNQG